MGPGLGERIGTKTIDTLSCHTTKASRLTGNSLTEVSGGGGGTNAGTFDADVVDGLQVPIITSGVNRSQRVRAQPGRTLTYHMALTERGADDPIARSGRRREHLTESITTGAFHTSSLFMTREVPRVRHGRVGAFTLFTHTGHVAFISGSADNILTRVHRGAGANTQSAHIILSKSHCIVTRGTIGLEWLRAFTQLTHTNVVTLIESRASNT
jgi:hypothetical protein